MAYKEIRGREKDKKRGLNKTNRLSNRDGGKPTSLSKKRTGGGGKMEGKKRYAWGRNRLRERGVHAEKSPPRMILANRMGIQKSI